MQRINVHRYRISKDLEERDSAYPKVLHVCVVSEGSAESVLPTDIQGLMTFVTPYEFKMQHFMMCVPASFLNTREIKNVSSSQTEDKATVFIITYHKTPILSSNFFFLNCILFLDFSYLDFFIGLKYLHILV